MYSYLHYNTILYIILLVISFIINVLYSYMCVILQYSWLLCYKTISQFYLHIHPLLYQDIPTVIPTSIPTHHHYCVIKLVSSIFFVISLILLRSSNEQGRARRVHCITLAVFYVARQYSHVTSPSKYPPPISVSVHCCM